MQLVINLRCSSAYGTNVSVDEPLKFTQEVVLTPGINNSPACLDLYTTRLRGTLSKLLFNAVSRLWRLVAGPFTAEALIRSQVSLCEIYGGQSGNGQVFLLLFLFSSVNIISSNAPLPSSPAHCC